jgi:hypothetical protein
MILATNNRMLDEPDYKEYMRNLQKDLEIEEEQKFDRNKFEQLRALANSGGNRAK